MTKPKTKSQKPQIKDLKQYSYKELKIIIKCKTRIVHIYKATEIFPKSELYGLTSQIRRASVSVVLNITEGRRKKSDKDFLRYLTIADASLAEAKIAMDLALLLNFIKKAEFEKLEAERKEISYMLSSLIRRIKIQC